MAPSKLVAVLSVALWHSTDAVRTARKKVATIAGVPILGEVTAASDDIDLIVAFKAGTTERSIESFCAKQRCLGMGHPSRGGVAYAAVKMGDSLEASVMDHVDEIEFMEYDAPLQDYDIPEVEFHESALQNDIPWGLERVGVPASPLKGEGTHIYVLDSGIRSTHTDFGGRAIPTMDANQQPPLECDPSDFSCARDFRGHGSHCAGSAGGTKYGVAPKAALYALNRGRSFLDAFNSMDWVIVNHQKPAVLTMSFGGVINEAMAERVLDAVVASGVTVTMAAGNNEHDACLNTFAYIQSGITVGCTDPDDARSYFSNYGSCVDILAPGRRIISAIHTNDSGSSTKSGTSMATPHVAGGAALILEANPAFTPQEVKDALRANAEKGVVTDARGTPNLLMKVA